MEPVKVVDRSRNARPDAHDAAGQKIAQGIVPLDADGNPDPINGKIVLMPVSV